MIYATFPTLTFTFKAADTINLEPKKYKWDISIYHDPIIDEDGELIGAAEIDSYYSAFKLPICEIREVALDMCKERWNTRDLLLDAENPEPPVTYVSSIRAVYPWESMQEAFLAGQLYEIAKQSGYTGTIEDFNDKFGKTLEEKTIFYSSINNFPVEGELHKLYFDINTKILYYWDNGYFPVQTDIIENTILQGGKI